LAGAALVVVMSVGVLIVSWTLSTRRQDPGYEPPVATRGSAASPGEVAGASTSLDQCASSRPCTTASLADLPARPEMAPAAQLSAPPAPASVATIIPTSGAGVATLAIPPASVVATTSVVAANPEPTVTRPAESMPAEPAPGAQAAREAPRRVVLDERFADNARGWPNDPQSTAWIGDGGYRLFARQPGQFVAIGVPSAPRLGELAMTGTFRKVGGPPGGGYGLIVRDQADEPRNGVNQRGRYYVLEAGDRGELGVWRRDGERWVDLLPWTPSQVVRPGNQPNELTVRASGDRLIFIVNGIEVTSHVDPTLATGTVGVFAGGDGNQVLLQQIVLASPE